MESIGREALDTFAAFLRTHAAWGPAILFGVMVLEGFILTTFLFSGTLLVLAAGALIQNGVLDYKTCFAAILAGYWIGDTINFEIARRSEGWIRSLRPVRARQDLLIKAQTMIDRYGVASIAISRFLGPTRAFVTLLAGACHMERRPFHLATGLATLVLTAGLLNAGMTGMQLWERMR